MDIQIEDFEGTRIIRLPENALKECRTGDTVHLDLLRDAVLVKPVDKSWRKEWEHKMNGKGRKVIENLLIEEPSAIEMDDWEW